MSEGLQKLIEEYGVKGICKQCGNNFPEPDSGLSIANQRYWGFCDFACHFRWDQDHPISQEEIVAEQRREEEEAHRAKEEKDFFYSPRWRTLRYETLRERGAKCEACGVDNERMHVDHIKPRSKFPELEFCKDNLQVLCETCNLGRSNKYADDWRRKKPDGDLTHIFNGKEM